MIARGTILVGLLWTCLASGATTPVIRPYLEMNGKEVEPTAVQMSQSGSQIAATLRAPRDGTYRFGVSISADEITTLETAPKAYSCAAVKEPLALHYPYDWTRRDPRGNIFSSQPRLVMPGLKAAGQIYLADTHELFSLRLEPCANGSIRALLLAHRFFNDGGDRATPELHLRAGETRKFIVRIYKDIEAVNRDRFGEHDRSMQGYMTALAFLEYAEDTAREQDSFYSAAGDVHCCRSLTAEEWGLAARKLQGVFRYAIIRDQLSSSIAPIFHKRGVQIYHYQYLGAWRRHSADVTPDLERDFALRDVKGQLYMAPRSPDGVFLLMDIRRPEVRARFVQDARAAVRAGFDGVFLDGWPFWPDATGDIGGNAPSATESWAYARWQLLGETKEAVRAENRAATLGILTNHYFDTLGLGDWMMREFVYGGWYSVEPSSGNNVVGHYQPATGSVIRPGTDRTYEEGEAQYIPGPIAYGAKGFSPIAVQSSLHFILHPSGLYYTEAGTFPAEDMEKWLDTVVALVKQNDLYITDIDPASCAVRFEGAATMQSQARCAVKFSRPACVTQLPNGKPAGGIQKFTLEPGARYKLSRECAN